MHNLVEKNKEYYITKILYGVHTIVCNPPVTTPTPTPSGLGRAIFGFGSAANSDVSLTNLVSNTGVVATDTAGVGAARSGLAAAGYGGDKAIFGFGFGGNASGFLSMTNLVSNTGAKASVPRLPTVLSPISSVVILLLVFNFCAKRIAPKSPSSLSVKSTDKPIVLSPIFLNVSNI